MNVDQAATIKRLIEEARPKETVGLSEIARVHQDRTLLLGVTADGNLFHVYLQGLQIHVLVKDGCNSGKGSHMSGNQLPVYSLVPTAGSVFPEWTDYEFLLTLVEKSTHFALEAYLDVRGEAAARAKSFDPFSAPVWAD